MRWMCPYRHLSLQGAEQVVPGISNPIAVTRTASTVLEELLCADAAWLQAAAPGSGTGPAPTRKPESGHKALGFGIEPIHLKSCDCLAGKPSRVSFGVS